MPTGVILLLQTILIGINVKLTKAQCISEYPWKQPCGPSFIIPDAPPPNSLMNIITKMPEIEHEFMRLKARYVSTL